jgi:hypothetical protein
MKKIVLLLILCGLAFNGFSIVPAYSGARSLSLGYGSVAFNYDINAIFLNPSLLAGFTYSLSGYQYQNSYMDYKNFSTDLMEVLDYDLANFESLAAADRSAVFSKLQDVFGAKTGMFGFSASIPGFISRGYGLSVSLVNTAIVNPLEPSADGGADIFAKNVDDVTNDDIAGLRMNFLGLKYKQVSLSYGMEVARSVTLGVTIHYLKGKLNDFSRSLLADDVFNPNGEVKDYLELAWQDAEHKFSKVVADVGASVNLGRFFKAGIVMRNFGGAKIKTPDREIALHKRVIVGLAFRPNPQWGFYLDMDVKKADLLYNGNEIQPISLGIEKGFFANKFFVRAGMLNDITEQHFFGKKSNALYGFGIGFNMSKIVVDLALGLDNNGTVKNLAISGFFMLK